MAESGTKSRMIHDRRISNFVGILLLERWGRRVARITRPLNRARRAVQRRRRRATKPGCRPRAWPSRGRAPVDMGVRRVGRLRLAAMEPVAGIRETKLPARSACRSLELEQLGIHFGNQAPAPAQASLLVAMQGPAETQRFELVHLVQSPQASLL